MNERRPAESVWDYPRPPAVEASHERVQVRFAGLLVGKSRRCLRVLETSHPPVYYLPVADLVPGILHETTGSSWCEWKGRAPYWDLRIGLEVTRRAAWDYPDPRPAYRQLQGHVAFYPARVEVCLVDGEQVTPQPGDFYGGWITSRIRGPFKGAPGTAGW